MSSDYSFVRFTNRGSKLGNYKISVNRSDSLGILSGFYLKEGIRNYKKAVLFFDKAKKAVAINFTNDEDAEGAFAITHNGTGNNSASVAAHSFFTGNELKDVRFLGQTTPRKIKDDKLGTLFVIDLLEK